MKLNEIIEPQYSETKLKRSFDTSYSAPRTKTELGRGAFSAAQSDPTDPHMVKKRQLTKKPWNPDIKDRFDLYANIIIRDKLWEMIHFPRIYGVKKYIDSNGTQKYQWKIEKLISSQSISIKEGQALNERYFGKKKYDDDVYNINIVWNLQEAIEYGKLDSIKDETLLKASKELKKILNEIRKSDLYHNTHFDLSENNIMFRRSSHGLDLIFSDPFYSRI